jgi:hypothetical protein
VLGPRRDRFLRRAPRARVRTQTRVRREAQKDRGQRGWRHALEGRPLSFVDRDVEPLADGPHLVRNVKRRDFVLNAFAAEGRAQTRVKNGQHVVGAQGDAESEQRGTRIAQGVDLSLEPSRQFEESGFYPPALPIELRDRDGVCVLRGQVREQRELAIDEATAFRGAPAFRP